MNDTEFLTRVSYSYHKKRERFFRINDAGAKFLSIVALTALATMSGATGIIVALTSGAATILSIVLDFPGMASKHEGLAGEYLRLLADITDDAIDEKDAARRLKEIGAKEPAVLRGLAQICSDEVDASIGCDVPMKRLSNWRRLTAHFGFGERPVDWAPRANTN